MLRARKQSLVESFVENLIFFHLMEKRVVAVEVNSSFENKQILNTALSN
jgi:hypothetical protein